MTSSIESIAYGPVPSRRLGRSMGINNIPPKICSYSCVYCQLGRTEHMEMERQSFYGPRRIYQEVERQVKLVENNGGVIDVLTFVPDGEPTLDSDLGEEIDLLKGLGYPVAVITNSGLLFRKDVREELARAGIVSVKVDTVREGTWRNLNRPHGSLQFQQVLDGVSEFSDQFPGTIITETMLVKGLNDSRRELEGTAEFIKVLNPSVAYLSVPIRPPSESYARAPDDEVVLEAMNTFWVKGLRAVALTDHEMGEFTFTGDLEKDIAAITSVHPMREESIRDLCRRSGESWNVVEDMVDGGCLEILEFDGIRFYRKILRDP